MDTINSTLANSTYIVAHACAGLIRRGELHLLVRLDDLG